MTWRTWLKLGRVSNLPTVWSNGLAGWALSGAALEVGALALHRAIPVSPHLEVETYTWGVLPEALTGDGLEAAVARELEWVKERLA